MSKTAVKRLQKVIKFDKNIIAYKYENNLKKVNKQTKLLHYACIIKA